MSQVCTGIQTVNSLSTALQDIPDATLGDGVVGDPLPFLVAAGERLAASLDYDQTLTRLLDIVVPSTLTEREKKLYEELRDTSRFNPRSRFGG